jgi:hypothetical protein
LFSKSNKKQIVIYDKMITFVTSYLFYEHHDHISDEFSIENLIELCRTDLPLIVFVYDDCCSWIRQKLLDNNIEIPILIPIQKTNLAIWRLIHKHDDATLPQNRNHTKDTREHLWKTHVVAELVNMAIQQNPFETRHFAWIHYSLPHIVRNPFMYRYLRDLCNMNLLERFLIFPGCADQVVESPPIDDICWRFSGGFFLGDGVSISRFYDFYLGELSRFLRTYRKLVWEVNFYAYLEGFCRNEWNVTWYHGNHDDSIIQNIPRSCFTRCLMDVGKIVEYSDMPEIPGFYPTSASYLHYYDTTTEKSRHYLNTRYVNYWLFPNGNYRYMCDNHIIENHNVVCELDDRLMPISWRIMENVLDLPHFEEAYSRGLEDLRLYEIGGNIKFSATNLNHVEGSGRSRIIVGDYCVDRGTICNGVIVEPPTDTWCEKNWIPIVYQGEECFVYAWSPFQIGKIDHASLVIVCEVDLKCPLFRNVRGSSVFARDDDGCYFGVVHFSEEGSPRKYYHMLVEMEEGIPVRYSQPFCFQTLSVEFCIGFAVNSSNYVFWISRMDRDPAMVIVPRGEILCNNNVY